MQTENFNEEKEVNSNSKQHGTEPVTLETQHTVSKQKTYAYSDTPPSRANFL